MRRREGAFIAAVTCAEPAGTCFCASMGGGPHPEEGYDLALTELVDPHRFVVEIGSELGAEVLAELPTEPAEADDLAAVGTVVADASARMGRAMDTEGLRDLLYAAAESPVWDDVGNRCLACMNCTMVCPTCFCTTVEDVSVLGSDDAERRRVWDSCFSEEFAHIHGGSLRTETQVALPPVADPQARRLAGPVRRARLRGLRPLHHVVPGRHRHHRRGGQDRAAAPLGVGGAR